MIIKLTAQVSKVVVIDQEKGGGLKLHLDIGEASIEEVKELVEYWCKKDLLEVYIKDPKKNPNEITAGGSE